MSLFCFLPVPVADCSSTPSLALDAVTRQARTLTAPARLGRRSGMTAAVVTTVVTRVILVVIAVTTMTDGNDVDRG